MARTLLFVGWMPSTSISCPRFSTSAEKYIYPFLGVALLLGVEITPFGDCDHALLTFFPSLEHHPGRLLSLGCFEATAPYSSGVYPGMS